MEVALGFVWLLCNGNFIYWKSETETEPFSLGVLSPDPNAWRPSFPPQAELSYDTENYCYILMQVDGIKFSKEQIKEICKEFGIPPQGLKIEYTDKIMDADEIEERPSPNKWMVRTDGKAFPVSNFVYGNEEGFRSKEADEYGFDDFAPTFEAASWLLSHTKRLGTWNICEEFILAWAKALSDPRRAKGTSSLEGKGYPLKSEAKEGETSLNDLAELVCACLDFEFMRMKVEEEGEKTHLTVLIPYSKLLYGSPCRIFVSRLKPDYFSALTDPIVQGKDEPYRVNGVPLKRLTKSALFEAEKDCKIKSLEYDFDLYSHSVPEMLEWYRSTREKQSLNEIAGEEDLF